MVISKEIEFDMGHRIPHHKSKCRSPHGHRYKLIAYLEGDVVDLEGKSDHGMVMDFGDIKRIMMKDVHDVLDHSFMYWEKDEEMSKFYEKENHFKSNKMSFTPTVENMAAWIFECLDRCLREVYEEKLLLHHVELYETPTCKAICYNRTPPWK